MATYLVLTKLGTESFQNPSQFRELAARVAARIRAECPNVRWKDSYAVMGRYDVVDVIEAPSAADVERSAMIIRAEAHATTETLHATPWEEFLKAL
jgi:uncharacterized protein with GYD domain